MYRRSERRLQCLFEDIQACGKSVCVVILDIGSDDEEMSLGITSGCIY
jgi:hypothetical protein